MAISEENKRLIRETLSRIYSEAIPPVKTRVRECWIRPGKGQKVTGVNVECLTKAGEVIGAEMKKAWGKE
jgi:hypothetical protein